MPIYYINESKGSAMTLFSVIQEISYENRALTKSEKHELKQILKKELK